ncbi:MAG TPA: hypothetical protein VK469_20245 [Candidatus Kapabacteria bacterium]|nr:hypothetical protein [Candidatus Kapabacteria bacterium]
MKYLLFFTASIIIFVSSAGSLNICEKASEDCPKIGHVDNGFDFDGIRKILRNYNEKIIENKCWDCELWFLCNVCIAHAYIDDRFEFNCCSIKKTHLYSIKHYLEKTEEENDKKYASYIYSSNRNITDFIDQL